MVYVYLFCLRHLGKINENLYTLQMNLKLF